jgi:hypothetical protein
MSIYNLRSTAKEVETLPINTIPSGLLYGSMDHKPEVDSDEKWIELRVQIPDEASWEEVKNIEDEISEAAGEILKNHKMKRKSHKRTVTADYSQYTDK